MRGIEGGRNNPSFDRTLTTSLLSLIAHASAEAGSQAASQPASHDGFAMPYVLYASYLLNTYILRNSEGSEASSSQSCLAVSFIFRPNLNRDFIHRGLLGRLSAYPARQA